MDLTKAIELNPKGFDFYAHRGEVYNLVEMYSEAVADCTRAIEIFPKAFYAYKTRSVAYRGLGDLEKAIKDEASFISIRSK